MMMNDKNPDVREEVAKRIGIEHLPMMMNDKNPDVREAAKESLKKLKKW